MTSPTAIALAKRWEGFHRVVRRTPVITAVPYLCPAGYWTIAWGSLVPQDHPPVTEAEGEILLARDLAVAHAAVARLVPNVLAESDARLGAVVSWTFNLGGGRLAASTMRRALAARDWPRAARECRRWIYGGGRVLPGLVARREAEALLIERG